MASVLERPCPNCRSIGTLQMDSARGEVACENCCIVIASGLEEDSATRYVQDATFADADEGDVRGGIGGAVVAGTATEREATKGVHSRLLSYLRRLREKTSTSEATLNIAVELLRALVVKKRERAERIDKPMATCAACFYFASCRSHTPIPFFELAVVDPTLKILECRQRLTDVIRTLSLGSEYKTLLAEAFQRDLLRLYLQRLRWSFELLEEPTLCVIRAVASLKLDQISPEEEVLGSLCFVRLNADIRRHFSSKGDLSYPETALLLELAAASRLDSRRIEAVNKVMMAVDNAKKIVGNVVGSNSATANPSSTTSHSDASSSSLRPKRERDE